MDAKLNACLNLNRRMPPVEVETTLDNLITLAGDDMEETLLQTIDVPLGSMMDAKANKKFITCDYNRDGDSFRSPHTNEYLPPLDDDVEDAFLPSNELRGFEIKANHAFNIYRDLYFQGGVSSVYCWDLEDGAFASCWACKKDVEEKEAMKLHWSEIHIFEVKPNDKNWDYKLTSTVIVHTDNVDEEGISLNVSGNRTIQMSQLNMPVSALKKDIKDHHVVVMGKMAESSSSSLLSSMAGIYYAKTNEIMSYLHQNEKDRNKETAENLRQQMERTLKAKNSTI